MEWHGRLAGTLANGKIQQEAIGLLCIQYICFLLAFSFCVFVGNTQNDKERRKRWKRSVIFISFKNVMPNPHDNPGLPITHV
jgi:hypothetical protein